MDRQAAMIRRTLNYHSSSWALLVSSVALLATSGRVSGAIWPLTGYESCLSQTLGGPWASPQDAPTPTGVALDADNDFVYAAAGSSIY
eukprot:scaffold450594_cov31-Prasinocladus_malaysianus.AAC.1